MTFYLKVVWQAVMVFPFAAAVIALPFLIHHYRKYGSMTFARFFLAYSFVLYGLCAYFLVIPAQQGSGSSNDRPQHPADPFQLFSGSA